MSIASEYAKRLEDARVSLGVADSTLDKILREECPCVEVVRGPSSAKVTPFVDSEGNLQIDGFIYTPMQALKLAKWICDTFTEDE